MQSPRQKLVAKISVDHLNDKETVRLHNNVPLSKLINSRIYLAFHFCTKYLHYIHEQYNAANGRGNLAEAIQKTITAIIE